MARIKLSAFISSISGSVGGSTFQLGNGGLIIRSKPSLPAVRSFRSNDIRTIMPQLHSIWSSMSPELRDSWSRFVIFSKQKINKDKNISLSGYNLFLKYNFYRLVNQQVPLVEFSYLSGYIYPDLMSITSLNASLSINFNNIVKSDSFFFSLKLSNPRPRTRQFSKRNFRSIVVPISKASIYDISSQYVNLFGVIPSPGMSLSVQLIWYYQLCPIISSTINQQYIIT